MSHDREYQDLDDTPHLMISTKHVREAIKRPTATIIIGPEGISGSCFFANYI